MTSLNEKVTLTSGVSLWSRTPQSKSKTPKRPIHGIFYLGVVGKGRMSEKCLRKKFFSDRYPAVMEPLTLKDLWKKRIT